MLCRVAAACVLTLGIELSAHSAQLDPQQIGLIRDTAASICNTVKDIKGERTDVQVQGEVKGQLSGLLGRLASAGASGTGTLSRDEFEGLSQDATAIAIAGDRECREHLFDKMFDKITATPSGTTGGTVTAGAGVRPPPSSSGLPSIENAEIVASTTRGWVGHGHSVGLHACTIDRSSIRCSFVIEALDNQEQNYDVKWILGNAKLIDNFFIEHKLARSYFLDGRGQRQEKLNLWKGDRVWFIAEFDGGSSDITSARIVGGNETLETRIK